jgi:serine/threonine-protein phosphatase 2A regulatory subunit B''
MQPKLNTQPEKFVLKASNLTQYQNCTVDPRHCRDVHCPNLNACLINVNINEAINCNTVHFGYAIPVNVVQKEGGLAQLILESGELSEGAVRYLEQYRPLCNMAAAVNHRKFTEPEEDIAAIAKQISDHAEAIYQNWKSRGLAPSEILSCNNINTSDNFGNTFTPKKPVDILSPSPNLNPNNLEQLVNNFVVEDKARLARQKSSPVKNVPSSVQFAKQKFETKEKASSPIKENVLRVYPKPSSYSNTKTHGLSQFIMDTIETTLPEDLPSNPPSALQTWPLKNKSVGGESVKNKMSTVETSTPKTNEYLDEVAKEEERLINALKTGIIITEDPHERDSKPDILQKKALKGKPTGLVKMVVKSYQEQAEQRDSVDYTQSGKKILRTSRRLNESAVPHPELTGVQKQHIRTNATVTNPVRPFLTRGSVAERVLIFEKCPSELGLDKRKSGISVSFVFILLISLSEIFHCLC